MLDDHEVALPTESTSGTNILDIPDDCLHSIFSSECLYNMDLYSIGQAHYRFKKVIDEVYANRFKKYSVHLQSHFTEIKTRNIRRIFSNYGHFISELSIWGIWKYSKEYELLLDWVTEYCTSTLKAIHLYDVTITEAQISKLTPVFDKLKKVSLDECYVHSGKTLFSNCESLVELKLWNAKFDDLHSVLKNTFPKLVRFECGYWEVRTRSFGDGDSIWNNFFSRHKNLKELNLRYFDTSLVLPVVADNCKQLVEMEIRFERREYQIRVAKSLSSILAFEHLKILKFFCFDRNITEFLHGLRALKSLEFLSLTSVKCDAEFIPAISKLSRLQVLELWHCRELTNLNLLADSERLTKLTIESNEKCDFDLIKMIKGVNTLRTLHLYMRFFRMDKKTYLQIVDVVRGRLGRFRHVLPLQITCHTENNCSADSLADEVCRKVVKIKVERFHIKSNV